MEEFLLDFEPFKASASRTSSGAASISIINTEDNGRRIKLSKKALEIIGNPEQVQLGFNKTSIIVAADLPKTTNCFKLSKNCIYNSSLVLEITEKFNLDYSEGRTSLSFAYEKTKDLDNGKSAIFFKII